MRQRNRAERTSFALHNFTGIQLKPMHLQYATLEILKTLNLLRQSNLVLQTTLQNLSAELRAVSVFRFTMGCRINPTTIHTSGTQNYVLEQTLNTCWVLQLHLDATTTETDISLLSLTPLCIISPYAKSNNGQKQQKKMQVRPRPKSPRAIISYG